MSKLDDLLKELVQARESWNLSKEEMAEVLNTSIRTIYRYENGEVQASTALLRYADSLGYDVVLKKRE